MVLWNYSKRAMLGRPGRTFLTFLSIVFGVLAVVAVGIVTTTTRTAYKEMFAAVNGKTALEIKAEGDGRFELADLVERIEAIEGIDAAVPIIQRMSKITVPGEDEGNDQRKVNLQVFGIDSERDKKVRDYELKQGRAIEGPDEAQIESSTARSLKVKVGDNIIIFTGRRKEVQVVGIVEPKRGSALKQGGVVFVDFEFAQGLFKAAGSADVIQIVLLNSATVADVRPQVAAMLPQGLSVRQPAQESQTMKETLNSSERGLQMSSMFVLLLASFIIFNTFQMNVGERRKQLSIMRAIGATRRQIRRALVFESIVLGIFGIILGMVCGVLVAYYINRTLSSVFEVAMPSMVLTVQPFVLASSFGLGISFVGALYPAIRAGRLSPLEGMRGVAKEDLERISAKFILFGFLLFAIGCAGVFASVKAWINISLGIASCLPMMIGMVLLLPLFLEPVARSVTWFLQLLGRVEAHLALRQILRHRTRSTLTIGVLFLAAATSVGMASTILDNVNDVRDWYRSAIVADFIVRVMMTSMNNDEAARLPEEVFPAVKEIAGVMEVDTLRVAEAFTPDEHRLVVVIRDFASLECPSLDFVGNIDRSKVRDQLHAGQVLMGTVLAQRIGKKMGDDVQVKTLEGLQSFHICGLVNEYYVGGLTMHMQQRHAKRFFGVEGIDALLIKADPKRQNEVYKQLEAITDEYRILLHTNAEIRTKIDGMVSGVNRGLWGLVVLGFVVASFGVVNTLTMNVLEQTRELGMLRIVAMTRAQVRKAIFSQAAIIACVGLTPGILFGIAVAYITNLASIPVLGHPIEFNIHPQLLVISWLASVVIVFIAAGLPAERAARLNPVEAMHYE